MEAFVSFCLFAILDLVLSTIILMRGWDLSRFWDSFKSYTVTDVWDLWVLGWIRIFLITLLCAAVRYCSCCFVDRGSRQELINLKSKKKGNKKNEEEEEDAAASYAMVANMTIFSWAVICSIAKVSYILCFSELVTDGSYWHWMMVIEASVATMVEYLIGNLAIKALGARNVKRRRHRYSSNSVNGEQFEYTLLKQSDSDQAHESEDKTSNKTCGEDSQKQVSEVSGPSDSEVGIMAKLEKLRAKRKIIWRLIQMAALDYVWLLLGLVFLLIAAFTQVQPI